MSNSGLFLHTVTQQESTLPFENHGLAYERFLSRTARSFLSVGLTGFNACMDAMVRELGPLLEADWAFACKNDASECGESCQWFAGDGDNSPPYPHALIDFLHDSLVLQLRAGHIIVVNDAGKEMPAVCTALNPKRLPPSFIAMPLLRPDDYWGVICVACLHQPCIWTTAEIGMLKTVADIVKNPYLRIKMEKQLCESNRVLVEYDECLQELLSLQESLTAVTRRFLNADAETFPACVKDMLGKLCALTDADYARILTLGEAPRAYCWHKRGLLPVSKLTPRHLLACSRGYDFLHQSDYIAINDTSEASAPVPAAFQGLLSAAGIKSLLGVPIRDGVAVVAVLFLTKCLGACQWDNLKIHAARQFSDIFLDAYRNMQKQQRLAPGNSPKTSLDELPFIKDVVLRAQLLIDATAETLPNAYSAVCQIVSEHIPITSVTLTRYTHNDTATCAVFRWQAADPLIRFSAGLHHGSASTALSLPLTHHNSVWGFLIVNFSSPADFDTYTGTLKMLADYFIRAYLRVHPDSKDGFDDLEQSPLSILPHPAVV